MKPTIWITITIYLAIIICLAITAFHYGKFVGTQKGQDQADAYYRLYVQAITWQNQTNSELPQISRNPQLKEKTK